MSIRLNAHDRKRLHKRLMQVVDLPSRPAHKEAAHVLEDLVRTCAWTYLPREDEAVLTRWRQTVKLTGFHSSSYRPANGDGYKAGVRIEFQDGITLPNFWRFNGDAMLEDIQAELHIPTEAIDSYFYAWKALERELEGAAVSIASLLNRCRTDKQLIEACPEIAPVVAQVLGVAPNAVQTDAPLPKFNLLLLPA